MNIKSLIDKLAEHGITAAEAEVKAQLGDVSKIDESDISEIVALWEPGDTSTGQLAKSKSKPERSSSITKLDPGNLPQVSSLSNVEADTYIAEIEAMDAQGQAVSDELVAFLCDLYDRRQAAIELAVGAAQRFKAQDAQLNSALGDLNNALANSIDGLKNAHALMNSLGQGGARLGDNFRHGTQRWRSAADRFAQHASGAESA